MLRLVRGERVGFWIESRVVKEVAFLKRHGREGMPEDPEAAIGWLDGQVQAEAAAKAAAKAAEKERKAAESAEAERRRPKVEVVRYKSVSAYQQDAQRRIAAGWHIEGQSQETGRTHRLSKATNGALIGGLFLMPLAGAAVGGLSGKRSEGPITVTWVKPPQIADQDPAFLPPAD